MSVSIAASSALLVGAMLQLDEVTSERDMCRRVLTLSSIALHPRCHVNLPRRPQNPTKLQGSLAAELAERSCHETGLLYESVHNKSTLECKRHVGLDT